MTMNNNPLAVGVVVIEPHLHPVLTVGPELLLPFVDHLPRVRETSRPHAET